MALPRLHVRLHLNLLLLMFLSHSMCKTVEAQVTGSDTIHLNLIDLSAYHPSSLMSALSSGMSTSSSSTLVNLGVDFCSSLENFCPICLATGADQETWTPAIHTNIPAADDMLTSDSTVSVDVLKVFQCIARYGEEACRSQHAAVLSNSPLSISYDPFLYAKYPQGQLITVLAPQFCYCAALNQTCISWSQQSATYYGPARLLTFRLLRNLDDLGAISYFKQSFINDTIHALFGTGSVSLSFDRSRLSVVSVRAGSVLVDLLIQPSKQQSEMTAMQIEDILLTQLNNSNSVWRTQSMYGSALDPTFGRVAQSVCADGSANYPNCGSSTNPFSSSGGAINPASTGGTASNPSTSTGGTSTPGDGVSGGGSGDTGGSSNSGSGAGVATSTGGVGTSGGVTGGGQSSTGSTTPSVCSSPSSGDVGLSNGQLTCICRDGFSGPRCAIMSTNGYRIRLDINQDSSSSTVFAQQLQQEIVTALNLNSSTIAQRVSVPTIYAFPSSSLLLPSTRAWIVIAPDTSLGGLMPAEQIVDSFKNQLANPSSALFKGSIGRNILPSSYAVTECINGNCPALTDADFGSGSSSTSSSTGATEVPISLESSGGGSGGSCAGQDCRWFLPVVIIGGLLVLAIIAGSVVACRRRSDDEREREYSGPVAVEKSVPIVKNVPSHPSKDVAQAEEAELAALNFKGGDAFKTEDKAKDSIAKEKEGQVEREYNASTFTANPHERPMSIRDGGATAAPGGLSAEPPVRIYLSSQSPPMSSEPNKDSI